MNNTTCSSDPYPTRLLMSHLHFRFPLLKQNLSDMSISVGGTQVCPSSKVRDLGIVFTNISFFIIILVLLASLLIFTCIASGEFRTF